MYKNIHWKGNLSEIFDSYFELEEKVRKMDLETLQKLPSEYRDFLQLHYSLSNLILTGEEIIEIGLLPFENVEDLDKLKKTKKHMRNSLLKFGRMYKVLKGEYNELKTELEEKVSKIDLETLSRESIIKKKLGKILAGKNGTLVDEIYEVIGSFR